MLFTDPMPYAEAAAALGRRTPVASALSSAEWAGMPLALRDRAFFSAKVQDISLLAEARRQSQALNAGKTDRATARTALKSLMGTLGADVDETDLQDIKSDARLNLILDTNVQQAQGYGHELQGLQPEVVLLWPAKELVDTNPGQIEGRRAQTANSWPARWAAAGGQFYGKRMIALKGDPIWRAINRFGNDYAPYDFGSYWVDQDVDRATAIAAGLKVPESLEEATLPIKGFNDNLEATLPDATPEVMEGFSEIFGDQVEVNRDTGKVSWQGSRIAKFYERALADPEVKWLIKLGQGSDATRAKALAAGVDIGDSQLVISADQVRHANKVHGAGETRGDQQPLTSLDFELVPHVWRDPDHVEPGNEPGTLLMRKDLFGDLVFATYEKSKVGVRLATLYKKKGGTP